jgi:outer membrane protein OmpA-like peptidoglycan-associated protein
MRKFIVGGVAIICAAFTVTACGGSGDRKTGTVGKAGTSSLATDLAQKASVKTDVTPVAAVDSASMPAPAPVNPDSTSAGVRHTLVLGESRGGFAFNAKTLSDEAKAMIDEMFKTRTDLAGAHFVIEGHTDNLGRKDVNDRIGLERAEAVRLYLNEKHQVSWDCIGVISYGSEQPVADNATDEGRAQNRRVVIKVVD